jgi:hypothetical protein
MNLRENHYFIVGMRPVRLLALEDGLDCESFDWNTGTMVRDMNYLTRVVMGEDVDVDEVSEGEFNAAIEKLLATHRATGKWS